MDKTFPRSTQKTYLPIFMDGLKYHAKQQRDGKSPDSCGAIRDEIRKFPWP